MDVLKLALRLTLLLGVLAAGCTVAPATPAATPATAAPPATSVPPVSVEPSPTPIPEKAVLRIGWLGKPDTLNPAYAFLTESYVIFDLVYSSLVAEATTGEYVGDLASSWKYSDDGLTWTFTLKDNLRWHDGTAFTADDMVWAINAVMSNPDGWAALANYTAGFDEVKALDPKTVQIKLANPIGNMLYRLSFLYAIPRKDFERFTTPEDLQNFTNDKILGTGPFKMNLFDKDKGILILDKNPYYYDTPAIVDQLIFQTFDNADAMVQALKVGDVDMTTEVPTTAFQTVKAFANVKVVQQSGRYFSELIINSVPADHDPAPTGNPALADPQVRLALAMAVNKQDLVDIVLQGLGKPGVTIVPPTLGGGYWYNSSIKDVEFSLDKANEVLETAGYVKGSDGVRAKGDVRLEFRLQYPSDSSTAPRVADLMTGWFKDIGVKASPASTDPDSLTAACCPAADYDLILWGWGSDPDPDFILSVMTSDQFVDGGWSDSGYHNPEYDQLYLDQQAAVDPAKRQQIVWKMQEMVFNDRPYIVYWYEDLLQAYRSDRFKGFIESPLGVESRFSLLKVEPIR